MRAHLVQLDITWEDRQANFDRVERLLSGGRAEVREGDLVVLPEMFDTGFSLNTGSTADRDSATLRYLTQLAGDLKVTVQGGRTVVPKGSPPLPPLLAENRAPIIGPDGRLIAEYAKVHPFSFGREPERFRGGTEVLTYPWEAAPPDGHSPLTVCPAICYDLRFPELFRRGLLKGAELFAVGANWPDTGGRQHHWRALLIARAIENQAFVLGVNRTGRDPTLNYVGGSIAIGPRGEVLGELGPEEAVLSVEINPRDLRAWRETFPAWRDIRLIAGSGSGGGSASGPSS
ncbi:MAG: nitrilase-related carbon-nitrogen hydrolase [Phycisphaerales bacterium]